MPRIKIFESFINKYLYRGKPAVAFGLAKPNKQILNSLKKVKKYASIILVGPKAISGVKGFKKVVSPEPEKTIAAMLYNNEVEGVVRGTIDDFTSREAYAALLKDKRIDKFVELGLVEDVYGRQFYISDGSNPSGWSRAEKVRSVSMIVNFMKSLGIKPKVGCITGVRHQTFARRKNSKDTVQKLLNETYRDAEYLVKYFSKNSISIKNYAIEIETALNEGCNLVVPPNGMVGNQIFRTLVFLGGGKLLTASCINLPQPWEDNSRSETDFENHVKWLVAWINSKK